LVEEELIRGAERHAETAEMGQLDLVLKTVTGIEAYGANGLDGQVLTRARTWALVGSRTQSRRRSRTSGRMTRPYSDCL
jgi:hypothetical protein